MRNIIKKWLTLLLFSLLIPTQVLSQTTFDSIEVKEIALIFAEHQKLLIENPLLKKQITDYQNLTTLYEKQDSLREQEIQAYKEDTKKQVRKLKNTQKKIIIGSTLSNIVLFILGLIL